MHAEIGTCDTGSVSGDNMDIPRVPHDLLRPIQSTVPAGPWLFPTPDIWQDHVVIETVGGDRYSTMDIEKLLRDLHLNQQVTVDVSDSSNACKLGCDCAVSMACSAPMFV